MDSIIVKIWATEDGPNFQLYSTKKDIAKLKKHATEYLSGYLSSSVIDYGEERNGREPGEDPGDIRKLFFFRVALYKTKEINTTSLRPTFFQEKMGAEKGSEFSPIIHILEPKDGLRFLDKKFEEDYKDTPRYRFIIDSGIWNYLATNIDEFQDNIKTIISNWKAGYYYLHVAREFADLNARLVQESYLGNKNDISKTEGHGKKVSPFLFHSERLLKNKYDSNNVSKYKWRILLLDDKIDNCKTDLITEIENDVIIEKRRKSGILTSVGYDTELAEATTLDNLTKAVILENRLKELEIGGCKCILSKTMNELPHPDDYNIQIVCVETIDEALKLMRKYEFDIILLDYLLQDDYGYRLLSKIKGEFDKKTEKKQISKSDIKKILTDTVGNELYIDDFEVDSISNDAFEGIKDTTIGKIDLSGTNIRDLIVDRTKPPFKEIPDTTLIIMPARNKIAKDTKNVIVEKGLLKGPQNLFFFMFISAFTTAVNERLTLEGFARDEEYWLIGEGACPTNTPELFKYRLAHLMERRLNQTGIKDLTEENFLNTVKEIFIRQQNDDEEWIKSVRERAYDNYHKILGFHYDYSILRKNDRDNSLLVKSFLERHTHLGAMLEHLLQLVHLTAFGTVRQWPEIWEEYKFFARTITTERTLLSDISDMIESYIIALKSE